MDRTMAVGSMVTLATSVTSVTSVTSKLQGDEFILADDATREALGWTSLWAQFQPVSPYGLRAKKSISPFLPGDEEVCRRQHRQLQIDNESYTPAALQSYREALAWLPDVDSIINSLSSRMQNHSRTNDHTQSATSALTSKEAMLLKQFSRLGTALAGSEMSDHPEASWTNRSTWQSVQLVFGGMESDGFSVTHLADEAYQEAQQVDKTLVHELALLTRTENLEWMAVCGIRPNAHRQLILPLPEKTPIVEQLRRHEQLQWLVQTPFEAVFAIVSSTERELLEQKIATARERVEGEAARLMQALTTSIIAAIDDWITLVADVTALDLRLARVALLHAWGGSAATAPAESGNAITLQGAFHPLVAERLKKARVSYMPLILTDVGGVNVLSGLNMGGKTVAMATLCVCQMCLQLGLPVPATQFTAPLVETVWFVDGASTAMQHGLSSFGHEVSRLTEVWRRIETGRPLFVCIDEPGRSTNPVEGEALAVGIIQAARQYPQLTMWVASHFTGVTRLSGVPQYRVRGLRAGFREAHGYGDTTGRLSALMDAMEYQIERVTEALHTQHEALAIAEWLGLPKDLLTHSLAFLRREDE